MAEALKFQPIAPFIQSREASCVVASITMVFRGLGVNVNEDRLIEKYFPNAGLPASDMDSGVTNQNALRGMVQMRADLGLKDDLQIDVFEPYLGRFVRSKEQKFIVQASPHALRAYGREFPKEKEGDVGDYIETLHTLTRAGEIRVFTANERLIGIDRKNWMKFINPEVDRKFNDELEQFLREGHTVGPHGGMTRHTRVVDGYSKGKHNEPRHYSKTAVESFVMVDPASGTYPIYADNLVWVDNNGVRGDSFDRLFRVSIGREYDTVRDSKTWLFLDGLQRLVQRRHPK